MMEMASPVAVVVAEQEDLGDLKLYRVPEQVTVNAKGQKQVAMIVQPNVSYDRIYVADARNYAEERAPVSYMLRSKNDAAHGLGVPLPAGNVAVFENSPVGPLLAGEGDLPDRAIGDEVEIVVGQSPDVRLSVTEVRRTERLEYWRAVLSNARDHPVTVEMKIHYEISGRVKGIDRIDGVPTWRVTVPAHDEATLDYSIKLR
jgi:hypothetical protein